MLSWSFHSVQICVSCVRFVSLCISLCSVARQFYQLQNAHFASQNGHFASNLPCFGAAVLHLLPVFLCRINITSPLWELLFFTFGLQFAAFYPAFCSVLPCVLLHFTLRFAVFCIAFCGTLHCVLLHFALLFGAKRNCFCIVCVFMQYSTGQRTVVCSTHFYLNNPLQYSIFCGRVAVWMILMPLFVLNFVLKR